ncbi:MAG: cupin [Latescibacteria bacterium DG_63]|nr:MAG: cupin [Latescibacteria bacterium DG_63]
MKVIHFNDAERYEPQKDWKRVSLCSQEDVSIEHFVKPPGHVSPLHQHPCAQVLVVLKGRLVAHTADGQKEVLEEGDTAYLPGNVPHTVTNPLDKPSIGLDIFVPGRSFDFWLTRK